MNWLRILEKRWRPAGPSPRRLVLAAGLAVALVAAACSAPSAPSAPRPAPPAATATRPAAPAAAVTQLAPSSPGTRGADRTPAAPSTATGGSPAASAPTAGGPAPSPTGASGVKIVEPPFKPSPNWAFEPTELIVKVGSWVTWTNTGAVAHTATADDGKAFDSGSIDPQVDWSFMPMAAGTFAYHCAFHSWMKGTLQVEQ